MDKKKKTYVLDTSVVIEDPDVFYKFGDGDIVLPTAVIREIDGLKKNPDPDDPRAKAARKVARFLDRLGSREDISIGARTSTGFTVRICSRYTAIDDLASNADNRIVGTAIRLKEECSNNVILVSADGNMRNVTRAYGIRAENYPFHFGASLSRPKEKILAERTTGMHLRSVPARSEIENKRPESKGTGTIVFIVIAIIVILLLISR